MSLDRVSLPSAPGASRLWGSGSLNVAQQPPATPLAYGLAGPDSRLLREAFGENFGQTFNTLGLPLAASMNAALQDASPQSVPNAFGKAWLSSATPWAARELPTQMLDTLDTATAIKTLQQQTLRESGVKLSPEQAEAKIKGLMQTAAQNRLSYSRFLNLGDKTLTFRELLGPGGMGKYRQTVQSNFAGIFKPNGANQVSPWQFVGKRVEANVQPVTAMIRDQKISWGGLGAAVGLGALGWDIVSNTRQAYQQAKAQEDGTGRSQHHTWMETGKAFLLNTTKGVLAWEAASLGYKVAANLLCVASSVAAGTGTAATLTMAWPAVLAGIAFGAVCSVLARRGVDALFPPNQPAPVSMPAKVV